MSRDEAETHAKRFPLGKEPKTYAPARIRQEAESLRELIKDGEGVAQRMDERVPPLTAIAVPSGKGGAAYEAAKKALQAWSRGLVNAYHDQVENET